MLGAAFRGSVLAFGGAKLQGLDGFGIHVKNGCLPLAAIWLTNDLELVRTKGIRLFN